VIKKKAETESDIGLLGMNFLEKSALEAQEGRYTTSEKLNEETRKLLSRIAQYNGQYRELNAVMNETNELNKAINDERCREREPNSKIINHYFERDRDRNDRDKDSKRDRRRSRSRSRSPEYQISRKQTRPDTASISFLQRKHWHVGKIPTVNKVEETVKEKEKTNAVNFKYWTVKEKPQNISKSPSLPSHRRSPSSRSPSPEPKKNKKLRSRSKSPSPSSHRRSRSPSSRSPSPEPKKNKKSRSRSRSPSPSYPSPPTYKSKTKVGRK